MMALKIIMSTLPAVCGVQWQRISDRNDVETVPVTNRGTPACWIYVPRVLRVCGVPQGRERMLTVTSRHIWSFYEISHLNWWCWCVVHVSIGDFAVWLDITHIVTTTVTSLIFSSPCVGSLRFWKSVECFEILPVWTRLNQNLTSHPLHSNRLTFSLRYFLSHHDISSEQQQSHFYH